jgi:hypothetical protein
MPDKEGNEGRKGNNYEERQTSDPGNMPGLRNQDVQDWQKLDLNQR